MSSHSTFTVRVPATSANLGPGFDCLGLALGLYNEFTVTLQTDQTSPSTMCYVSACGEEASIANLPADDQNLFLRAYSSRLGYHQHPYIPIAVTATVAIPPGRGLGSSATAVVGGMLAADAIAGQTGQPQAMISPAVDLEAGGHADNVAAALCGGLTVVARDERTQRWLAQPFPLPETLTAVLFIPTFPMDTAHGRTLLPSVYSRTDAVHNLGHVALLLAALANDDGEVLCAAIDDRFHEPYRATLFPQLPALCDAARVAGATGAFLSGGGSTVLAFARNNADRVKSALQTAADQLGVTGRTLIVPIDRTGAQILWPVSTTAGSAGDRVIFASYAPPVESGPALLCHNCGARAPLTRTQYRCDCGEPFDVDTQPIHDGSDATFWRDRFDRRLLSRDPVDISGVWRFRDALLPLSVDPVTRMEGQTHLYPVGRDNALPGHARIGNWAGVSQMWIKHEGENPTGSFKDRGMTMGVSIARWLNASAVACASTGNTSASMAAYAAQAGMKAIVLLPAGKVATGKLGQALAYGAVIRQIDGDFDQAMADVERVCLEEGVYLLNSLNPFRILGQQSLAFELAQQFGWDVPDWIVLPAGNLGNTSALGMGLQRAYAMGLIARLPRIASIQAAGANPFYQSYLGGFADMTPIKAQTIATAINIGNPVSFKRARGVIRATNGVVAQVTDDEILRAKAEIDRSGIGCEPASATSVAGVRQLVQQGIIQPDERVVAITTGNVLKDPDTIMKARALLEEEI